MKATLKLILFAIPVLFLSCQKDEVAPSVASSITSSGTLSGTISGYAPNTVDSVKAKVYVSLIGTCKVSSTGEFSVGLSIPELYMIHSLSGVNVSDTTAMTGTLAVACFKKGVFYSELSKSSCSQDSLVMPGMSASSFVYSDRDLTLKGVHSDTYTSDGFSWSDVRTYQITLKKGWNELIDKTNSYSISTTSVVYTHTISNTVTSNLKWRYSNNGYFMNQVKKSGIPTVKLLKVFPLLRSK